MKSMLNKLRTSQKKILIGLLFVIVPAFVLWGGLSSLQGRKKNTLGTLNNKNITVADINYYLKMAKLRFILSVTENKQIKASDIENLGIEFLILTWKANQEKIKVSDEEVIKYIRMNFFPHDDFNLVDYEGFLKRFSQRYRLDLTSRNFEEYVRNFIKIDKLFAQSINNEVSEAELRDLYQKDTQEAKIAYIFIPYDKFRVSLGTTAAEIKDFYDQNKVLFQSEPKINIAYLLIDEDINLDQDSFRKISRAKSLYAAAKELSLPIKETGFIGATDPIKDIGWQPRINTIAFSLKENEMSLPIETEKGIILMEKKAYQKARTPPLGEIKAKVKENLIATRAKNECERFSTDLLDDALRKNLVNLKKVAAKNDLEYTATDYFKYYGYIQGLGFSLELNKAIFALKINEIYKKIVLLENGVYIIQLKELTAFDGKDFEEKRAVLTSVITQKKILTEKINFINRLKKEAKLKFYQ